MKWILWQYGFVSRMLYFVHPIEKERFYLWLFLMVVCGPSSFEDLCAINEVIQSNFKSVYLQIGLLDDDKE